MFKFLVFLGCTNASVTPERNKNGKHLIPRSVVAILLFEYALASVPASEYRRSMPHLLIPDGTGAPQKHEFEGDRLTVGRYPDNTVVLDDGSVSGHHAEIAQAQGQFTLRDVGSSNGTTVNSQAVGERVLQDGDVISFGAIECKFQGQREPATPEAESTAPPSSPEPESRTPLEQEPTPESFGSKLGAFGKAALGEAKRAAKMAALKGKIEKLKMVDLNKAHYALGKKCHELGLLRDQLGSHLDAITEMEQRITSRRETIAPVDQETTGGKIKRVAEQTKNAAEAEALALKLKQLLTAFGEQVATLEQKPVELESELNRVAEVNNRIATGESELQRLSGEKEGWNQLKGASHSLANESGSTANRLFSKALTILRKRPRILAATLCILILSFGLWKAISFFSPSYHGFDHAYVTINAPIPSDKLETVERLYANPVPYFDQPVAVPGVIRVSAGSGLEPDYKESDFYSFTIRSEDSANESKLVAFFSRKNGSELFDDVSKVGKSGIKGVFIININRHTKNSLGYTFRNTFWQYIECELIGYGPSFEAINALISHDGNQSKTANRPGRSPHGLNISMATLKQHLSSLSFQSPSYLGQDTILGANADGSVMALIRGPDANVTYVQCGIRIGEEDAAANRAVIGTLGQIAEDICGGNGREWVLRQLSKGRSESSQRFGSVVATIEFGVNQVHYAPGAPQDFQKPMAIFATATFTPSQ